LSFLKNGVSAYAVEVIFNIKFEDNFVVVRLVHEVTGGVDCSFTPQGGAYPYLGGQEELTEPWDEGSQADFSHKTTVGASYSNGSEVSVAFAKPMKFGATQERPEFSWQMREVLASPAVMEMQSFKCCGRRPSGPAPEPCGKEEIAARIWAVLKQIGEVSASGGGGSLRSSGAWGVFVEGCGEILHWG